MRDCQGGRRACVFCGAARPNSPHLAFDTGQQPTTSLPFSHSGSWSQRFGDGISGSDQLASQVSSVLRSRRWSTPRALRLLCCKPPTTAVPPVCVKPQFSLKDGDEQQGAQACPRQVCFARRLHRSSCSSFWGQTSLILEEQQEGNSLKVCVHCCLVSFVLLHTHPAGRRADVVCYIFELSAQVLPLVRRASAVVVLRCVCSIFSAFGFIFILLLWHC